MQDEAPLLKAGRALAQGRKADVLTSELLGRAFVQRSREVVQREPPLHDIGHGEIARRDVSGYCRVKFTRFEP